MKKKNGFGYGAITFDHVDGIYQPGQMVYGKLSFDLNSILKFRGIYLVVRGYCEVFYTTKKKVNGSSEDTVTEHRSQEDYFNKTLYLAGSVTGSTQLHQGHHTLPFECLLPANCPSSFEGPFGHIRYQFRVVLDKALQQNEEKLAAIKVVAPMDLNTNPYCREPIDFELISSYCCWCISSGQSETIVKLPMSGYCVGQTIPVEVECTNESNVKIKCIRLYIQKEITYQAVCEPDTKKESVKIMELSTGPIPPHVTKTFTVDMKVPSVDSFNLYGCQFIDIQYYFYVSSEPKGCHNDTVDSRRIIIGNIPVFGPGPAQAIPQMMMNNQILPNMPSPYNQQLPYNPQVPINLI